MWKRLFGPKSPKKIRRMTVRPLGLTFEVPEGRTLLDAALDQGISYPHSCCAAECGTCLSLLIQGEIREQIDTSHLVGPAQKLAGYFLACQAHAVSDEVLVELPGWDGAVANHPLIQTDAKIVRVEPLTHDIHELELELSRPIAYTAGQYAELAVPGELEEPRNYSFARAPVADKVANVVFNVRKVPGGAFTTWLWGGDRLGTILRFTGPRGQFALRYGQGPILCVAGGSGLAPIRAILEQAAKNEDRRPVELFFGVRQQRDLYGLEALETLRQAWGEPFELIPVLSDEPQDSGWQGKRGFVSDQIATFEAAQPWTQAYLCGPPPMVDATISVLIERGLDLSKIYFDKFSDKSFTVRR